MLGCHPLNEGPRGRLERGIWKRDPHTETGGVSIPDDEIIESELERTNCFKEKGEGQGVGGKRFFSLFIFLSLAPWGQHRGKKGSNCLVLLSRRDWGGGL